MTGITGFPGNWKEPSGDLLDQLTRHGASGADLAVIGSAGTQAEKTRAAIRSALRLLLANGLIAAVPPEDWPPYVVLDAPGPAWARAGDETP
jgi:hypothetical protein